MCVIFKDMQGYLIRMSRPDGLLTHAIPRKVVTLLVSLHAGYHPFAPSALALPVYLIPTKIRQANPIHEYRCLV